jgi:hypothetical protein
LELIQIDTNGPWETPSLSTKSDRENTEGSVVNLNLENQSTMSLLLKIVLVMHVRTFLQQKNHITMHLKNI